MLSPRSSSVLHETGLARERMASNPALNRDAVKRRTPLWRRARRALAPRYA